MVTIDRCSNVRGKVRNRETVQTIDVNRPTDRSVKQAVIVVPGRTATIEGQTDMIIAWAHTLQNRPTDLSFHHHSISTNPAVFVCSPSVCLHIHSIWWMKHNQQQQSTSQPLVWFVASQVDYSKCKLLWAPCTDFAYDSPMLWLVRFCLIFYWLWFLRSPNHHRQPTNPALPLGLLQSLWDCGFWFVCFGSTQHENSLTQARSSDPVQPVQSNIDHWASSATLSGHSSSTLYPHYPR